MTMDVFVDDQERSLVTSTDNDTIDHSALNAFSFAETQAIILRKTGGDLKYETVLKTDHHHCICTQRSPFPGESQTFLD